MVAAGIALVTSTFGALPAHAVPAPDKDLSTNSLTSTQVPGGFASWSELLATQDRLVKAADRIAAAAQTLDGAGYAGIVVAPESHELRVYWKGSLPKTVDALVGELRGNVPVNVLPARFSARELQAEADRIAGRAGRFLTSIAAKVDGSGLVASGFAVTSLNPAIKDAAVPVTLELGVRPTPATRWNDSPPWWGGGAWTNANTGGGCSTGFAVNFNGPKMLSAAHCGDVPQTATDPTGEVIGPISSDNNSRDVLLINASSGGRVFNNTPGSPPPSEFSNPVIGTSSSFVGMWICTSGAPAMTSSSAAS